MSPFSRKEVYGGEAFEHHRQHRDTRETSLGSCPCVRVQWQTSMRSDWSSECAPNARQGNHKRLIAPRALAGSHSGPPPGGPGHRGGPHIVLKAPRFLPLSLAPRGVALPGVTPPFKGSAAVSCGCGKGIAVCSCMAYPLLLRREGDLDHHPGYAASALIHNF